jgi:hypothetical protein
MWSVRRVLSGLSAAALAGAIPVYAVVAPIPVYATSTDGSSALADIEEWFSPSTSLEVLPGGAGAGLGTVGELSGSALDISGEVAGVAADGAIALTPVGWAIAGGLAAGAGGYYAWKNRGAIIGAVSSVWNSLSSSQQSSLEADNAPGDTVTLPTSAIQSALGRLTNPLNGSLASGNAASSISAYMSFVVPTSWPQGSPLAISYSLPSFGTGMQQFSFAVPVYSGLTSSTIVETGQVAGPSYSLGSLYLGSGTGLLDDATVIYLAGVLPGETVYLETTYNTQDGSPAYQSNGLYSFTGTTVVDTNSTSWALAAVPNASSAAVPPSEVVPVVSSTAPSFFPGTFSPSTQTVLPIGQSAPNPDVTPASTPVVLPTGSPAPGFVTWLDDLFVPTSAQVESAFAPLQDAFGDRIPFSYVAGVINLFPDWVDGVGGGGCASFPIPAFGLNNPVNPGASGSSFTASVCPSGFMGGAFGFLKDAFTVILWAFLLGWGISMFASLLRQG